MFPFRLGMMYDFTTTMGTTVSKSYKGTATVSESYKSFIFMAREGR